MSKEAQAAERAEFVQSVKALLIPLSLFLACVVMAAGTFLVYNNESVGWGFIAVSTVMVLAAFVALIRFQNKYRVRGIIRSNMQEDDLMLFDPEKIGVGAAPRPCNDDVSAPPFVHPSAVAKVAGR
jgi:membrane protein YdbS with pleckstrin-like domain